MDTSHRRQLPQPQEHRPKGPKGPKRSKLRGSIQKSSNQARRSKERLVAALSSIEAQAGDKPSGGQSHHQYDYPEPNSWSALSAAQKKNQFFNSTETGSNYGSNPVLGYLSTANLSTTSTLSMKQLSIRSWATSRVFKPKGPKSEWNNNNSYASRPNTQEDVVDISGRVQEVVDFIAEDFTHRLAKYQPEYEDVFCASINLALNDYLFRLVNSLDNNYGYNKDSVYSVGMRSLYMSIIYIHRLLDKVKTLKLHKENIHYLFMISMLTGAKYSEDEQISQQYWSAAAGVSVAKLNEVEQKFCNLSEFDFNVQDDELYQVITTYIPE